MKEFNLDAALNGEPVKLACGRKAYILYDLSRYPELLKHANRRPLNGLVMSDCEENDCYPANWLLDGKNSFDQDNIIGIWEDPKISIEDLPKPFRPKDGEVFYYIYEYGIGCVKSYKEDEDGDVGLAENAQCYRTKEDAQKWLNFMKSMME
ncbi:hypothetical protein EUX48_02305 [Haemophilus haemolyticus]|uniref:Uncharacterized protein n=1 Tax=Haemophilus haemolyticus TaxID=726 RepID=A0A502LSF4_HAEHA|nr:hypothetical protein [Haemophilus haemolyticus]TPH25031.1 hypothetical protein EUX48_02305 [Haemophilus haemolyticus]